MTPELEALGRRAVACRAWRWMPGMSGVDIDGESIRVIVTDGIGASIVYNDVHLCNVPIERGIPDLSDPATLGCLLALVREAHEDPTLHAEPVGPGWECVATGKWYRSGEIPGMQCTPCWVGATEAEALMAALEAAP